MASKYSESSKHRALQTLLSINETLQQIIDWNKEVTSTDDYALTSSGMQLLAANAMLISAVGEGIKTIEAKLPGFLKTEFPDTPWHEIVGMRNHIVHGYFDLNAEIVLDVVKTGVQPLQSTILQAIEICKRL